MPDEAPAGPDPLYSLASLRQSGRSALCCQRGRRPITLPSVAMAMARPDGRAGLHSLAAHQRRHS